MNILTRAETIIWRWMKDKAIEKTNVKNVYKKISNV